MNNVDQLEADSSLPLVIGVTGHRDLRPEDVSSLEESVRQTFKKLQSDLPETPLILLSALAEGADRLAARVALELGVRLIVPLPMRRDIYETDFETSESKDEFKDLLNKAGHWYELPVLKEATEDEIKKPGVARDRLYEQLGVYVVRQSHLLIALWDGKYRNLVGGTSRIVKFQLEGLPEPYAPRSSMIDTPESGPVYHIVTPRTSEPTTEKEPFSLRKLFPIGYVGEANRFARICVRLNSFNRDLIDQTKLLEREVKKSMDYVLPEPEVIKLSPSLQAMHKRFAVADSLAIYYQRLTMNTLKQLFIFVLLAAICFDLYVHFFPELHWILGIYLLVLAIAYLWINRRAKRRDYQNKYQDYRALAEGMRVQFFWRLAGLRLSVADRYLRKQRSELDWICSAIRVWNNSGEPEEESRVTSGETDRARPLELVLQHWVMDQSTFFAKAAKRDHDRLERYELYVKALLRVGVGVAVVFTLVILIPHPWQHDIVDAMEPPLKWHALLLGLMSLPPIGAALLHGYIEKKAFSAHAKQYSRMSLIFSNAQARLPQMIRDGEYDRAEALIEELGSEALEENGDWVLLHRERPLEVPHAG